MTSQMPDVSIILPTYNERETLPRLVDEIHAALPAVPHEIIVVDDNSPDKTWRWVKIARRKDPALRLVRQLRDRDLSAAVLRGFRAARADRWIVMDADGQHDPAVLPALYKALATHELVVSSRFVPGGSPGSRRFTRRVGSWAATRLAQRLLDIPLSDPMSGYFGIRRDAYAPIAPTVTSQGFKVLLALYCQLRRRPDRLRVECLEVPCRFRTRAAGESKVTWRVMWRYLRMLRDLRKERNACGGV
jgi:dolichol-phosphate mannosyltransferase